MGLNHNKYIIFDIETVPLSTEELMKKQLLEYLLDKQTKNWYMSPLLSKIVAVGIKHPDIEPEIFMAKSEKGIEGEKEIIMQYWKILENRDIEVIVTYNGYRFDIPYMNIKSMIYGIKPSRIIENISNIDRIVNKRTSGSIIHLDCFQIFSGSFDSSSFSWLSLYSVAKAIDVNIPDTPSYGSEVYEYYKKGDLTSIERHNKEDLIVLEDVYKKITPYIESYIGLSETEYPTEKQYNFLNRNILKLSTEENEKLEKKELTKNEASNIIERIMKS
ncbi:MAG: ribonuclease H-like domain-containing protein [Candidatus Thermoplasmatota archaeon]|nr:ribonuclease H-like domain-containing protein [Candidatus Thermoplasmatota archaeon]MCL5963703.1 ribonuclease H-like domain-containing protein [Candidatus Thermoplasmatota archaeon]